MGIGKILEEKWGIKPDTTIGKIEAKSAYICSQLEAEPILMDVERLEADLEQVGEGLEKMKQRMSALTGGEVTQLSTPTQMYKHLLRTEKVPLTSLSRFDRYRYPFSYRRAIKLVHQYQPEIAEVWTGYRNLQRRQHSLMAIHRNLNNKDALTVTYDTLSHASGKISSVHPNINNGLYGEYFLPSKGKMLVRVTPVDFALYFIAEFLTSDILREIYYEGGIELLASKVICKPLEELTRDDIRDFIRFFFGRLYDDHFYPRSSRYSLKKAFPNAGGTPESQHLIALLMLLNPTDAFDLKTPMGRSLISECPLSRYLDMVYNDYQKAFMVQAYENLENARLKIIYKGSLIFEVEEDAVLETLRSDIEKLYRQAIPVEWGVPKIDLRIMSGGKENGN